MLNEDEESVNRGVIPLPLTAPEVDHSCNRGHEPSGLLLHPCPGSEGPFPATCTGEENVPLSPVRRVGWKRVRCL